MASRASNKSEEPLTSAEIAKLRSPKPLILQNASKIYRNEGQAIHAVEGVSLELDAGTMAALVGRSGCGKSTLLNLAGAMDFPTSGQVLLDEFTTSNLSDSQLTRLRREKVGFIFQSFQLLPTLTVAENVELPLQLAGRAGARAVALEMLEWVELADKSGRYPHQLSGGEMQRTAIARALVHKPRLLLADEPTGNLDTVTGNIVLELLWRAAEDQKATVLIATHSEEAAARAGAIFHMRDGRIENIVSR